MKRRSFCTLPAGLFALSEAEAAPAAERGFQLGCVTYNVLKDMDLPTLLKTLEAKGIEIWMEVHGRTTQDPPNAAAILKSAGHPNVGACWNSNPTDVVNGSVKQSFDLLKPYIRSAHINELYSEYPWRELFGLLRASGFKRYTLCEAGETKEPERFLRYYKALWENLSA